MKWFDPKMTAEEAKPIWRKLAAKYHPDVSDDPNAEEIFKEISNEYTAIVKGEVSEKEQWFDEDGATTELYSRLKVVEQLVTEIFPRLRATYWAFLITPTIEFLETDVPMYKVMRVVEVAQEVLGEAKLTIELHRPCRKKKFTCTWNKKTRTLYIDVQEGNVPTVWVDTGNGRRYKESVCNRYERVVDTKGNFTYIKLKSPTVDFRKDLLKV